VIRTTARSRPAWFARIDIAGDDEPDRWAINERSTETAQVSWASGDTRERSEMQGCVNSIEASSLCSHPGSTCGEMFG